MSDAAMIAVRESRILLAGCVESVPDVDTSGHQGFPLSPGVKLYDNNGKLFYTHPDEPDGTITIGPIDHSPCMVSTASITLCDGTRVDTARGRHVVTNGLMSVIQED